MDEDRPIALNAFTRLPSRAEYKSLALLVGPLIDNTNEYQLLYTV